MELVLGNCEIMVDWVYFDWSWERIQPELPAARFIDYPRKETQRFYFPAGKVGEDNVRHWEETTCYSGLSDDERREVDSYHTLRGVVILTPFYTDASGKEYRYRGLGQPNESLSDFLDSCNLPYNFAKPEEAAEKYFIGQSSRAPRSWEWEDCRALMEECATIVEEYWGITSVPSEVLYAEMEKRRKREKIRKAAERLPAAYQRAVDYHGKPCMPLEIFSRYMAGEKLTWSRAGNSYYNRIISDFEESVLSLDSVSDAWLDDFMDDYFE